MIIQDYLFLLCGLCLFSLILLNSMIGNYPVGARKRRIIPCFGKALDGPKGDFLYAIYGMHFYLFLPLIPSGIFSFCPLWPFLLVCCLFLWYYNWNFLLKFHGVKHIIFSLHHCKCLDTCVYLYTWWQWWVCRLVKTSFHGILLWKLNFCFGVFRNSFSEVTGVPQVQIAWRKK